MTNTIDWNDPRQREIGKQFTREGQTGTLTEERAAFFGYGEKLRGLPWSQLAREDDIYAEPQLKHVDIQGWHFESVANSDLDVQESRLRNCKWSKCTIDFFVQGSSLKNCLFDACTLPDSMIGWHRNTKSDSILSDCAFIKCDLRGMSVSECQLHNVVFRNCNLRRAKTLGRNYCGVAFEGKVTELFIMVNPQMSDDMLGLHPDTVIPKPVIDFSKAKLSDLCIRGRFDLSEVRMPNDGHAHSYTEWTSKIKPLVCERAARAKTPDEKANWDLALGSQFNVVPGEWNVVTDEDIHRFYPNIADEFLSCIKPFMYS